MKPRTLLLTTIVVLSVWNVKAIAAGPALPPVKGPLRVHPTNPRYFTDGTRLADGSLKAVYLTGSHTWNNLQDMSETDPPARFDFSAYLDFLVRHNHNFIRLWRWELVSWDTKANREKVPRHLVCAPHPWARTGPGAALDGKPKFNLERFDEAYFDRLRERVTAAGARGIYVSIMLFEGWGVQSIPRGWQGHPFHPANNVNGIDGDANNDGKGVEIHTLANPAITRLQEAYVRKVIDTVNNLHNILYEISNENHSPSTEWQYYFIRYIRQCEKSKPQQHPVGMTFQYQGGRNAALLASPADWISPNPEAEGGFDYRNNPPPADGRKVILSDTDHLWGIGGNAAWVWKAFTRGQNPLFMDPYDASVLGPSTDARWEEIRQAMGQTRRLAERLNLAAMTPHNGLASTGYCLADPAAAYVVYLPTGGEVTVDLTAASGTLAAEWLNPRTGAASNAGTVPAGAKRDFRAPGEGDRVLLLEGRSARAVALVRDRKPASVIVTAEKPTPAARLAALELQHHVEQITGATLPIRHPGDATEGPRILVGESEATRVLGLRGTDFQPQEYLIRIQNDAIILMGRDWEDTEANRNEVGCDTHLRSLGWWRKKIDYDAATGRKGALKEPVELPGVLDDQGTCYATYDFLERFCKVRWYGPTPLGVVLPSMQTLTVPTAEIRRSPSLSHRHGHGGDWPIINDQWNRPTEAQAQLYYRRLRFGGEKWAANHSFSSFQDRFLKKTGDDSRLWEHSRPDLFAVGWENEGHWRQLCLTNPDLIRQVVQDARDYFDGKGIKGMQPACGDYFAIVPGDTDHWCKCDRCQAALAPGKARDIRHQFGTGTASDYYFAFVNAVAKELRKTHPDKYIAALAYHVYSYPPTFELEPNVAVAPCVQICYGYQKGTFDNDAKFYSQWVADKGRRIHLWNYFHHPMERAIMGEWKCFPCFMPDVISEWVKRYHRDGVRGFFLCGIPQQLDYYLYMQTAFNVDIDYKELVDEFFSRYFGTAGEPMKRFYYRISEINRQEGVLGTTPEASWERLGTEERMNELGALINRAVELAGTDLEKRRVETWKKGVWDYMAEGRSAHVKKKRAHERKEHAIRIFNTGVDDNHKLLADGTADPHWRLTQSADDRWKGPETYAAESDTPPTPAGKAPSAASKWSVPSRDLRGVAPGTYIYEQAFRLEGVDPQTAGIVGRISADDVVEKIEINGKNIGQAGADFGSWRDFIVFDHFVAGINTLRIVVRNHGSGPNPHGLRVELSGSADGKRRVPNE